MSWMIWMAFLLILPLLGALFSLLLGRFLPKRGGVLVAAAPLFLAVVAAIVLVPQLARQQDPAAEALDLSTPSPGSILVAPTVPWVQAPRTLDLPTAPAVESTKTPTPGATQGVTPTPHPYSLVTVVMRNGTGETGLATRITRRLTEQGFRVLSPEDDPLQGSRPHTLILDRGDHPVVRQALARFLNISSEHIQVHVDESSEADIIIILGDDYGELASATPAPTPTLIGGPTATPNPYAGVTIIVRNGAAGRPGMAGRTADRLRSLGFEVIGVEDDDRAGNRPHTLLLDRGDHTAVRLALIKALKLDEGYVLTYATEPSSANIIIVLGDDFEE